MHTIDLRLETANISKSQGQGQGQWYMNFRGKLDRKYTSETLMHRPETIWQSHSRRLDGFFSDFAVPNFNKQFQNDLSYINEKNGKFIVSYNWAPSEYGIISFYTSKFLLNDQVIFEKIIDLKDPLDLSNHMKDAKEHIMKGKEQSTASSNTEGSLSYLSHDDRQNAAEDHSGSMNPMSP